MTHVERVLARTGERYAEIASTLSSDVIADAPAARRSVGAPMGGAIRPFPVPEGHLETELQAMAAACSGPQAKAPPAGPAGLERVDQVWLRAPDLGFTGSRPFAYRWSGPPAAAPRPGRHGIRGAAAVLPISPDKMTDGAGALLLASVLSTQRLRRRRRSAPAAAMQPRPPSGRGNNLEILSKAA